MPGVTLCLGWPYALGDPLPGMTLHLEWCYILGDYSWRGPTPGVALSLEWPNNFDSSNQNFTKHRTYTKAHRSIWKNLKIRVLDQGHEGQNQGQMFGNSDFQLYYWQPNQTIFKLGRYIEVSRRTLICEIWNPKVKGLMLKVKYSQLAIIGTCVKDWSPDSFD